METWLLCLLCLAVVLAGLVLYDSNRFHVVKYELKSQKIKEDFRFVFLSDLHSKKYGRNNEKLLKAIDACNPEAVLIGGDLLTARPGKEVESAAALVKELAAKYTLYYANGNHEQRLELYPEKYGDMGERYDLLLKSAGIHRLLNGRTTDRIKGLEVVGCEIDRRFYKRFEKVSMPEEYIKGMLPKKTEDRYTILMAHNPDYFQQYKNWGADLVLSGHVHGGVVRLPFVGGVIGTNFRLFPRYDGGKFESGDSVMIVSRGLGAHTIPFRLFNPAELVDIVIKSER